MGLFSSKKKKGELPLPPPPPRPVTSEALPPPPAPEPMAEPELAMPEPPALIPEFRGDFEPIRAQEELPMPEELPPIEAPEPVRMDFSMREEEVEAIAPAPSLPVKSFIAVEDFRSIIDNSNIVRAKIMEAEDLIKHLNTIKSEEEKMFDKWRSNLEHIEKKLNYVDKVIEKAQR